MNFYNYNLKFSEREGLRTFTIALGRDNRKVSEVSTSVRDAVQQQNGATREISSNIQEAATGTQRAAANVDSVTRKAAETGDSVSRVTSLGETLFTQSELLKETVGRVVENLRAAA